MVFKTTFSNISVRRCRILQKVLCQNQYIKSDNAHCNPPPKAASMYLVAKSIRCSYLYVCKYSLDKPIYVCFNCIGGVMVSVLASSVVDRGFEPRSGQTKDYKIGICCFSAKHIALRRKSKIWLTRNQDNVSEWGGMSIRGLLFQWGSTIKIQLSVLV